MGSEGLSHVRGTSDVGSGGVLEWDGPLAEAEACWEGGEGEDRRLASVGRMTGLGVGEHSGIGVINAGREMCASINLDIV